MVLVGFSSSKCIDFDHNRNFNRLGLRINRTFRKKFSGPFPSRRRKVGLVTFFSPKNFCVFSTVKGASIKRKKSKVHRFNFLVYAKIPKNPIFWSFLKLWQFITLASDRLLSSYMAQIIANAIFYQLCNNEMHNLLDCPTAAQRIPSTGRKCGFSRFSQNWWGFGKNEGRCGIQLVKIHRFGP